jgi:hypothetical protein
MIKLARRFVDVAAWARYGRVPVPVAVVATVAAALVGLVVYGDDAGSRVSDTVSAGTASHVKPSPVSGKGRKCAEDEPCFNPCTMGVNGLYPPADARYLVPGPCDLYTPLPYGRRFAVTITPEAAPPGTVCAADARGFTRVQVWVREANGANVRGTLVSETGCADGDMPGAVLAQVTPRLYRQAGALV